MVDTQQPSPQPSVPQPQPSVAPSPPVVIPQPPKQIPTWLIAVVVVMGFLAVFGVAKMIQKPSPPAGGPTPTPNATLTPTPIRQRSSFATTSAFMTIDNAVASYAASVTAYNASDPSL
ncbi:hypothetical protein HYV22_01735, partial [Candidatus Gottesmanbacteria bacterium]|nr:hypothetical protein [Candidatus Gottesmanbacteria bacterium]